jgi:hypothetical protein
VVVGTGFIARSTAFDAITEDKLAGPPGPYTATATMTQGTSWAMLVASFKAR